MLSHREAVKSASSLKQLIKWTMIKHITQFNHWGSSRCQFKRTNVRKGLNSSYKYQPENTFDIEKLKCIY